MIKRRREEHMRKIAIYLAGTIKKSHEKSDETYWTEEDMTLIKKCLQNYEVSFLNPAFRKDDLSDQFSVFGRDMLQVFTSHFVFVDARDRRGLGVGAEMMWAKVNKIPVVTWAPRNSHYRKDQVSILNVEVEKYVHPFVECLSDKIVDHLIEGAHWMDHVMANPDLEIKGMQTIGAAMEYYKKSQFHHDAPMKEIFSSCTEMSERMHRSHPQVHLTSI